MNTPTTTSDQVYLKRLLITEITITQDSPCILYQIPFELTTTPSKVWKQILLDIWQSRIQYKGRVSKSVMWVFHNRILIDNVSIELVVDELETLLTSTIEETNKQISRSEQQFILEYYKSTRYTSLLERGWLQPLYFWYHIFLRFLKRH